MAQSRLDKLLADAGIASRSELRQIIKNGRVSVDGAVVSSPETRVDPETSTVALDGQPLALMRKRCYMMDKPAGILTATEDKKQSTVLDLLSPELRRMGLFPVGRLDRDTTGLLLLTNDGELAHRVISPRSGIMKRYMAQVSGVPDETDVEAFRQGLTLRDGTKCLPAKLETTGSELCYVTVAEGKYHQVKRMLASRGKPVKELRRLSIGALILDQSLGSGGVRQLEPEELCRVFMQNV